MSDLSKDLDPAIREILPKYIEIRRREQQELYAALAAGDLEALASMGHRIKGTGASFGLPRMTDLGRELQVAAREGDLEACSGLLRAMDDLLDRAEKALSREE